jgi:hypothetical protein
MTPSRNVTVPLGDVPVTVATSVTGVPTTEGFDEVVRLVEVGGCDGAVATTSAEYMLSCCGE